MGVSWQAYRFRGKLIASLTYPCVLVGGCLLMLMVAPSYLLEGHLRMLTQSGVPLPWTTRLLLLWSSLLQPPALAAVAAGILPVVWYASRSSKVWFIVGFPQLVRSGELVGKADALLDLGADFYELELDLAIAGLTTLLEPVLLLVIGVVTAFLLTAVLQPTLGLLQAL